MILALTGVGLLLVVMLIAVRIGINKEKVEEDGLKPVIHASGIYSIIRKSPRESISDYKPSQEEILKYFSNKNVNSTDLLLSEADKSKLMKQWNSQMEANIFEIEKGDERGAEFYYYKFLWTDPVCSKYISKGRFVTREEIFQHPNIIPPFHLGCGCQLKQYPGKEKLHDTTEIGMLPLFREGAAPPLPDWKEILLT
jgi:hypothetical protein